MVNHGANLTVRDENGKTLLHNAVKAQSKVHLLIPPENICNKACLQKYLSMRDNNGQTACDIAKEVYGNIQKTTKGKEAEYALQGSKAIIDLVCYDEVEKQVLNRLSE